MSIKLSPSTLNLFVECPRCFWLAIKAGIKRPAGPFPSLPVGMDSVIKKYFDSWRGRGLPPILGGQIKGRLAMKMPKTLYFTDNSGYVLYGRPDEYIELGGERIAPLDHKTRASAPKELHRAYQNQLNIYDLLLLKNDYATAGKGFLVYYFPAPGELHNGVPFLTEIKEIKTNADEAYELFQKAIELLDASEPPPAHEDCEFCLWHEQLKDL